jgi:para-aminobenzoate synthetase/4-amino-4-deoxychorismate lyase
MRADSGSVALLDRHLDRLTQAAAHFRFPFDRARVQDDLAAALAGLGGALRVTLTVDAEGRVDIGLVEMATVPRIRTAVVVPWPEALGEEASRFKTTDRAAYDAALDVAWGVGADEAILVEADGNVVEATRANVWVRRGGDLITPSLEHRGLAGVMRAEILQSSGGARTGALTVDDLVRADEVLLSNAVRGLFRVEVGTLDAPTTFRPSTSPHVT